MKTYMMTAATTADKDSYRLLHGKCESLGVNALRFFRKKQEHYEPRHDKTNKMAERPAKTQIILGILPV